MGVFLVNVRKLHTSIWKCQKEGVLVTIFDSKQPKLEQKLVPALSETKRLLRLSRLYIETPSFGVSIKQKLTKQTEANRNKPLSHPWTCLFSVQQQLNSPCQSRRYRPPFPASIKVQITGLRPSPAAEPIRANTLAFGFIDKASSSRE